MLHDQVLAIARCVVAIQVNKLPKLSVQRYTLGQQEKK